MRTTTTTGVVAAAALAIGGLTLAPAQAAAPGGITISGPTYPTPQAEDTEWSPYVSETCGFEVTFKDATPAADYDATIASADGTELDLVWWVDYDSRGNGIVGIDCGYDDVLLVDGETYLVTVQEYTARGAKGESTTAEIVYDEVDAPVDAWVAVDGVRAGDTLPTARAIDIAYEGAWEEGSTFTTRVSVVPREVVESDYEVDEDPFVDVLNRTVTGSAPVSRFSLPHHLGGDYVFVSVRADKAGKAPVYVTLDPFEVVTSPPTSTVPSGWITSPGTKSGKAYVGSAVGVSAPTITHSGKVAEVKTYYQWFLDGKKIPGATKRTYVPPTQALGRQLTLGIQFSAPGYFARSGSFGFGTVGQRSVPAGWIKSPAVKSGAPRVGRASSVSGPTLTPTAVSSGAKVHYQWFVNGQKVPGATSRSWTPTASTRGTTLTLGIAVSKPTWKSLNQTVSFGRIG
ncbi:hypothetical protein QE364_002346 [Nocardioides zeae]|uniref:Uncharacterized protein n=2 Tax=Nocardioides zeae TaxID=1457234 RepID=A0AAJ1U4L1_9ACTN|nr:hypothetical protein [Nocardioides zeae]MDQ1105795.1 hypothetical protein [Nocardioides zeae]MDR6174559.1 hypothetical protein [Nocardioides zeae]MDR6210631.1 hypothetical protein [Nocardioides zeae]